jgi:ribonuclease E
MAGLVVIDFIDMEYGSNVRKVEKAMKDALKNDRARIQVGRISGFGLMEMSRQRLRTGVLEATTRGCPHCDGTGLVRTASSAGLSALRLIEDEAAKGKGTVITLYASTEAAVYLLNAKRADLAEIEERYGVTVEVLPEGEQEGAKMRVASTGPRPTTVPRFEPIVEEVEDDLPEEDDEEEEFEARESRPERGRSRDREAEGDGEGRGKRRRRRRGGRGRDREDERDERTGDEAESEREREDTGEETPRAAETVDGEDRPKKRRRRGGRRRRGRGEGEAEGVSETAGFEGAEAAETIAEEVAEVIAAESPEVLAQESAPKPRSRRKKAVVTEAETAEPAEAEALPEAEPVEEPARKPRSRRKKPLPSEAEGAEAKAEAPAEPAAPEEPVVAEPKAAKPKRSRRKKTDEDVAPEAAEALEAANDANGGDDAAGGARRGWWQRTFGE